MSVGDITSSERGTAARYNDGKTPLELIPARAMHAYYDEFFVDPSPAPARALACLERLATFEETLNPEYLAAALKCLSQPLVDAAWVFDYGRRKYAAWNWAKGFQWSVPMACAKRHIKSILEGQLVDLESKLPEEGHVACNIIMLMTFVRSFPEGNDLCPVEYLAPKVFDGAPT